MRKDAPTVGECERETVHNCGMERPCKQGDCQAVERAARRHHEQPPCYSKYWSALCKAYASERPVPNIAHLFDQCTLVGILPKGTTWPASPIYSKKTIQQKKMEPTTSKSPIKDHIHRCIIVWVNGGGPE